MSICFTFSVCLLEPTIFLSSSKSPSSISSSLRRFYAGLYDRVFEKNKSNLEKYYKALEAYICTLSTYDKMPSDSTFNEGLHYKNMYKSIKGI